MMSSKHMLHYPWLWVCLCGIWQVFTALLQGAVETHEMCCGRWLMVSFVLSLFIYYLFIYGRKSRRGLGWCIGMEGKVCGCALSLLSSGICSTLLHYDLSALRLLLSFYYFRFVSSTLWSITANHTPLPYCCCALKAHGKYGSHTNSSYSSGFVLGPRSKTSVSAV